MVENERKFVLRTFDETRDDIVDCVNINHHYLSTLPFFEVRTCSKKDFTVSVKLGGSKQRRFEFEWTISKTWFDRLKSLARSSVKKTRYTLESEPSLDVTVDVFETGLLPGLVLMEAESNDTGETEWVLTSDSYLVEVTGNPSFYNRNLSN